MGGGWERLATQIAEIKGIENEWVLRTQPEFIPAGIQGTYSPRRRRVDSEWVTQHNIMIQVGGPFHSLIIGTLFHEFAHALQEEKGLPYCERQAEAIAFSAMWRNGFWWEAIPMIAAHTIQISMPEEYRNPRAIWAIVFGSTAYISCNILGGD
jgi:hypothetical protein